MAKFGYYQPYFIVGAILTAVAGGLVYTFELDTSIGRQLGYQLLMGFGTGLVLQIPPVVAGLVTSNADKAVGLGVVLSELHGSCPSILTSQQLTLRTQSHNSTPPH